MAQHYSNLVRETMPHALPDIETFEVGDYRGDCPICGVAEEPEDYDHSGHRGWFYWFCSPGCMPDSEAVGPFATEAEALADARDGVDGMEEV